MPQLVVIGYNDEGKAAEVRRTLLKLEREEHIDLEDAVVAVRGGDGKVRLSYGLNPPGTSGTGGGLWGVLVGAMFLDPLLGAVSAASGAISSALAEVGVNDQFMRELASTMRRGSSTLFVLVRKSNPEKILVELQGTGGVILKTTLTSENQARLQAAFDAAKSRKQP
jgi:uncharacterized membrane protein